MHATMNHCIMQQTGIALKIVNNLATFKWCHAMDYCVICPWERKIKAHRICSLVSENGSTRSVTDRSGSANRNSAKKSSTFKKWQEVKRENKGMGAHTVCRKSGRCYYRCCLCVVQALDAWTSQQGPFYVPKLKLVGTVRWVNWYPPPSSIFFDSETNKKINK